MAAKLLHSLADDNPDLQKQIGCMTGIFQVFDRQHMLTSGGRIVGHSTKKLSSGNSHLNDGNSERESNGAQPRPSSLEKYSQKNMQDRVSVQSSRPSLSSSSRSSSFSSLDCNKATQLEQGSFDRMVSPETPLREPAMRLRSSLPQFSQQTLDLRDVVKDSMYREVPFDKHRDSPKLQPKISDGGSSIPQKQSTPADIKESLRILSKLQEAPIYHNEPRGLLRSSSYHSKSGSSFSISKDAPRFSYDGREISRTTLDPRDVPNSILKLRDLPRLSLDCRKSSMRNDLKSNLKSLQKDSGVVEGTVQNQQQISRNEARPPSVVAKLMGLETLPDSIPSGNTNLGSSRSYLDEDSVNISGSLEKEDPSKPIQLSSSKNSRKEPSSPRWRSSDSSMKPMSWLPIELAPWKQIEGTRASQKPTSRNPRGPAKAATMFPSVYCEIEKRLKDLEFTQSGKDLRALKQIMEAMQAKGFLESPKEGEGSNFTCYEDNQKQQTDQVVAFQKGKTSAQIYESPIVIMKPAKLVDKSAIPSASIIPLDGLSGQLKIRGSESIDNRKGLNSGKTSKDLISKSSQRGIAGNAFSTKNGRTLKITQTSTKSLQLAKERTVGLGKTSGSISPRMQEKKLELEKRSRAPTLPDLSRLKKQSNKQQVESNSPGGKRRLKYTSSQKSDELSEVSFDSKNIISLENEDSGQSTDNVSRGSGNIAVASSERSPGMASMHSPPSKAEKKPTPMLIEEEATESGYIPPEHSSPVSVLDNALCKHDSPSPIKYAGKTLKVDVSTVDERNSNGVEQSSPESSTSNSTESGATFDFNRKKLQNIENLVQKLKGLNSGHDEARIDYIASLCENTNPDHRYVSEILLASGLLLRDLGSSLMDFQFHPSGYPINPELFLVLEQTKASSSSKEDPRVKITAQLTKNEKFHRKLIFDSVNEILARKLASVGPRSEPWRSPLELARKPVNTQNLLKEVCSEIEGLQANNLKYSSDEDDGRKTILCNDAVHQLESWMDFGAEIPGAVLDIERSIFKDLVDDIVRGESTSLLIKPGMRKLSVK